MRCRIRLASPSIVVFVIAALVIALAGSAARADLPVSGVAVPELAAFDATMINFMEANGIEAGTLGIMYQGKIVFHRGYGWQDREHTVPLPANAMMRLASVTKPITAAAVHRLVDEGALSLDDRAIDIGQPGGGIVHLDPFPSLGDPRLGDITVRNLLQHRGGWDRNVAGDYTWQDVFTMYAMGLTTPPDIDSKLRYILGKPLVHDPGSTYAYSNEGYMFLGEVIETVTNQNYVDVVHQRVFDPIGVPAREVELGRSLVENRNPREPWYQSTDDVPSLNLFDITGPLVSAPDGNWNHEARMANGGLIASTKAILAYLENYQVAGDGIGTLRSPTATSSWNHTGAQDGVETLARQRGDGVNFVVMFNERAASGSFSGQIRNVLDQLVAAQDVWPEAIVEPGDGDGDTWLTETDIEAFVQALALGNEAAFLDRFPLGQYLALDFNHDGLVSRLDAAPFVEYMRSSGFSDAELAAVLVPEPSTALLAAVGILLSAAAIGRRNRARRAAC